MPNHRAARRGWDRVNRSRRCPLCGHADWCLVAKDGSAVICPRRPEGAVKDLGEAGYLHVLIPGSWAGRRGGVLKVVSGTPSRSDLAELNAYYRQSIAPGQIGRLGRGLGLTANSLKRLGIGWSHRRSAFTFPCFDVQGRIIGIRVRHLDGSKKSVRGGRNGLFIPTGLTYGGRLFFAEGATDTAALLDLGFEAVGRPSCRGGAPLVVGLVRCRAVKDAVVVADVDADGAGQRGAESLANQLTPVCRDVRVIRPPSGIKDMRAWLQAGATTEDVERSVVVALRRTVTIRISRQRRGRRA